MHHIMTLSPPLYTSLTKLGLFVPQNRLFWLLTGIINGKFSHRRKKYEISTLQDLAFSKKLAEKIEAFCFGMNP